MKGTIDTERSRFDAAARARGPGSRPAQTQRIDPDDGDPISAVDDSAMRVSWIRGSIETGYRDLVDAARSDIPFLQRAPVLGGSGDVYEQEADRVANAVAHSTANAGTADRAAAPLQRSGLAGTTPTLGPVPETITRAVANPTAGAPLDARIQRPIETHLGRGMSHVRVHQDDAAHELAATLGARAVTHKSHIWLGRGESSGDLDLMAHEATHVVQQGGSDERVQRYESGEHAQLGETQGELQAQVQARYAPIQYVVQPGDTLAAIAAKFQISRAELTAANKGKLRHWPARDGGDRMVAGFNAGELVAIPQKPNEFAVSAVKDKSAQFVVNGVTMDYGVGIALGDFFESPEQIASAPPSELKTLADLIDRERTGGQHVTTEEWEAATHGRYLALAEKNETHFAPPDPSRVPSSAGGAGGPNHKSAWERHHAAALAASQSGDRDAALMRNAFADHFLTDAFAAGHLINKRDLMEQFKGHVTQNQDEYTSESVEFFDGIAQRAFTGSVQAEFSRYETVAYKGVVFRPNIDSASRFSSLLQAIHQQEPDLLANAIALHTHTTLNTLPGGLPVENAAGDRWELSGDGTLNEASQRIARKAVAQSQMNVLSVYNVVGPLNYTALFAQVWSYTPFPSAAGSAQLKGVVSRGTSIADTGVRDAIVLLIQQNYMRIIEELVRRGALKLA